MECGTGMTIAACQNEPTQISAVSGVYDGEDDQNSSRNSIWHVDSPLKCIWLTRETTLPHVPKNKSVG